jgi:hypothetical protein
MNGYYMTNEEKLEIAYGRWKNLHDRENALMNKILETNGILSVDQVQLYQDELKDVFLQAEAISLVHQALTQSIHNAII